MSQRKVEQYKEEKRNRREIMRKEKAAKRLEITVVVIILAAILAWFGYLIANNARANAPAKVTELNMSALDEFQNKLNELTTSAEE